MNTNTLLPILNTLLATTPRTGFWREHSCPRPVAEIIPLLTATDRRELLATRTAGQLAVRIAKGSARPDRHQQKSWETLRNLHLALILHTRGEITYLTLTRKGKGVASMLAHLIWSEEPKAASRQRSSTARPSLAA